MAHSPAPGTSAAALSFTFSAQTLRVVMRDSEPWFVASDVCEALGIAETHRAISRLDDDEKGRHSVTTPGGQQEMTIINESGLYSLILTSRKPEAKKFKKWVTAEVLPAIRKTGRYVATAPAAPSTPPDASRERLSSRDQMALRRVVWLVCSWFHFESSWSSALYKHLRLVLNHPAPMPWYVDQFPALAAELRAVVAEAAQARDAIVAAERAAMKALFRKSGVGRVAVAELVAQAEQQMHKDMLATRAEVPKWLEYELQPLVDRTLTTMDMGQCYQEALSAPTGAQP